MADKQTVDLLKDWGFEDSLIQHFKAQAIDFTLLQNLKHDLIRELIPTIGLRMRFITKWKEHFRISIDEHQDDNSDTASDSSSESKENISSPPLKREKLFVGKEMYKRLQRPTVREILKDNEQGRLIVRSYGQTKILSKHSRHILLELLISHLINTVKGPVTKHDFLHLARGIIDVFPSEDINLYYIAPVSKKDSRNRKSISVRGKLVDKYRNKLRQNKRILADISDVTTSTDLESEASNDVTSEVLETSVKWLETNQEPWEVVENHWKATATIRWKDNRNNRDTLLSEIFEKWPILNHPTGWKLIVQDFEHFELSSTEDAINQWPQFFQNVLKVCPLEKKKTVRVNELLKIIESDQTDESKAIAQLCALSYMIPPKGRVRTKKGHWKPSMTESEESIVVYVKTAADISDIRQKRIDVMYQMGLTVQPYIIAVGPTLAEKSSFFISVDKVLYNVTSTFKAIDTLFKIFHVLNIEYPAASHHIWVLIQHTRFTKYYICGPCGYTWKRKRKRNTQGKRKRKRNILGKR